MINRILRIFLISILLINAFPGKACVWTSPERWYMFEFNSPSFEKYFNDENDKFWTEYCRRDQPLSWVSMDDMKGAAKRKNDLNMLKYLDALESYLDVAATYSLNSWEYPTAQEIEQRKQTLRKIISECRRNTSGPLANRWLLLEMRANMLSGNYADNIRLWENNGIKTEPGYVREMMRNIYANALLKTGNKAEAWNIYADQNDSKSLQWSTRKYTNLVGIKDLYSKYPDAPIHRYLLKKYVNTLQDVADIYHDNRNGSDSDLNNALSEYWDDINGKSYARIDKNHMKEMTEFVSFSDSVAKSGSTDNPCLWETASALCSYFLGDFKQAREKIDKAMTMKSDTDTKDMARRIRMLLATSSDDITTPTFKRFITDELAWLDGQIEKSGSNTLINARDRILNLGLTKGYEESGYRSLARLMRICRDYLGANPEYALNPMRDDIFPNTSGDITELYATLENPGDDPLKRYAASKIKLTDDFKNDILGTKYLQEGEWEKAISYLQKVSMDYLDNQPIAFYAARRDYTIPAWNGHQTVKDSDYEETMKPQHLKRNAKVDFCNYMLRLENEAKDASPARKDEIGLQQAAALYQASRFGQCWYLSQYGFTQYEKYPICEKELAGRALAHLRECAKSSDPKVKAAALFGMIYASPDRWMTETSSWNGHDYTTQLTVNRNSGQYALLTALDKTLTANPESLLPEISRCDVLRQWRKHR